MQTAKYSCVARMYNVLIQTNAETFLDIVGPVY